MTARVLVADDDPDARDLICTVLSSGGLEVVQATDGAIALDKLRGEAFDAAVLDVRMPGLTGIEVLERLNADPAPRLPVLVLTTYLMPGEIDAVRAAGPDDILGRPFHIHDLLQRVRVLAGLEEPQPA